MPTIKTKYVLSGKDNTAKAFASVQQKFRNTAKVIAGIGVAGAAAAAAGLGKMLKGGIAFAAELEKVETQFGVIYGSTDKAAQKIKELTEYAANTPFQLPEIAKGAKILTQFGMDSSEQLRLVGDAAAVAQRPMDEMAMLFGRIKSGAFGEAFMRLAETGVATREMLEQQGLIFDAGGSYTGSAEEAINAVNRIIENKFGGMTEKLAGTWGGSLSTMKDNWGLLQAALAEPVMDVLQPYIKELIVKMGELRSSGKLTEWGQQIAAAIKTVIDNAKILYSNFDDIKKKLNELKKPVAWLIGSIASITAVTKAYGVVTGVLGAVRKAWRATTAATNGARLAQLAFNAASPVGWIMIAITVVAALIQKFIGWGNILDGLKVAWVHVSTYANAFFDNIGLGMKYIWAKTKWVAELIGVTFKATFMTAYDAVQWWVKTAIAFWSTLLKATTMLGKAIYGAFKASFTATLSAVKWFCNTTVEYWKTLGTSAGAIGRAIDKALKLDFDGAKAEIASIGTGFKDLATKAKDGLGDITSTFS